jgi:Pyridoxamine 5'-phosphate oxidase
MCPRSPGGSAAAGTSPARPATAPADTRYFAPLAAAKYMLLTTFKRDGTPVATPVHVAVEDGRAYFRTWNPSGKWKRLRHTSGSWPRLPPSAAIPAARSSRPPPGCWPVRKPRLRGGHWPANTPSCTGCSSRGPTASADGRPCTTNCIRRQPPALPPGTVTDPSGPYLLIASMPALMAIPGGNLR